MYVQEYIANLIAIYWYPTLKALVSSLSSTQICRIQYSTEGIRTHSLPEDKKTPIHGETTSEIGSEAMPHLASNWRDQNRPRKSKSFEFLCNCIYSEVENLILCCNSAHSMSILHDRLEKEFMGAWGCIECLFAIVFGDFVYTVIKSSPVVTRYPFFLDSGVVGRDSAVI